MRLGKLTTLSCATTLVLSSFGASQNSPAPSVPTLRVYSRETIVDVLVTDAEGQPVRNLKQSDFTISEDGNPQPIRSFAEFGPQPARSLPPRLPPYIYTNYQATPATGPVNILLIDAMHCTPVDVVQALRGADRYISAMLAGTQMAVFWLAAGGLHMLQGFTSDPALLLRAVRNNRVSDLIDRYWTHYGSKKRSADRERSILEGIRSALGGKFVREVDGIAVGAWYENLTGVRKLSAGTAVRHFNVMHHMMEKASTIWSKETGLERNPANQVEVRRPDDSRGRYLSEDELRRLKQALDHRKLILAL